MASASDDRHRQRGEHTQRQRAPAWPKTIERDRHAIGADAEEHHMGERHDAGIAEQQIVRGDEKREDADVRRDIGGLRAGEQETAPAPASAMMTTSTAASARLRGAIAGEDHHRPLTG